MIIEYWIYNYNFQILTILLSQISNSVISHKVHTSVKQQVDIDYIDSGKVGLIVCLTLEECEDSKPCEGTVAGDLEHDKDCYQGYGRLKQFTTFMHRMFAFCCLEVVHNS